MEKVKGKEKVNTSAKVRATALGHCITLTAKDKGNTKNFLRGKVATHKRSQGLGFHKDW